MKIQKQNYNELCNIKHFHNRLSHFVQAQCKTISHNYGLLMDVFRPKNVVFYSREILAAFY